MPELLDVRVGDNRPTHDYTIGATELCGEVRVYPFSTTDFKFKTHAQYERDAVAWLEYGLICFLTIFGLEKKDQIFATIAYVPTNKYSCKDFFCMVDNHYYELTCGKSDFTITDYF